MKKFLWACWDGGGNLPPSLGIAAALAARGHEVRFAGRPYMLPRVRAAGFAARELTQSFAQLDRYDWHPLPTIFGYLSSPAVGEELLSVAREEAPDAVVIDAMFGAALHVADGFAAPSAVVVHTFVRRMFDAWAGNLARQDAGRRRAGFDGLPGIETLWGGRALVHANTLDRFDQGAAPLANLRHGAPVLAEEPRAVPPALPWAEDDPTPLVLLSFSTVYEQRSEPILQRALDALAPLPVRVVATTGKVVDPAALRVPANAVALAYASHAALMRRAALVLTHGGHGTAMRALKHGLPMVLTPALADDQPFVGAAVAEWGAGIALPREPEVPALRAAVEAVLADAGHAAAARALAPHLAGPDGAELAADALERLATPAEMPA